MMNWNGLLRNPSGGERYRVWLVYKNGSRKAVHRTDSIEVARREGRRALKSAGKPRSRAVIEDRHEGSLIETFR